VLFISFGINKLRHRNPRYDRDASTV